MNNETNESSTQPGAAEAQATAPGAEQAEAPTAEQLAVANEKLQAEKRELYDRLLRSQAELDNFRKRTHKEKEEIRQHAAENVIRALLPTLDGFDRALQHRDENIPGSYYKGMELIYKEFRDTLMRAGLQEIETEGKLFDPHLHQAVEMVKGTGHREHEIVAEMQRGYKLKNKLLRPAIVKVAAGDKE